MRSLLDSYNTYFKGLWPILSSLSNRGIPIDAKAREDLGALIGREQIRVDGAIKAIVPSELLTMKPKNGYKRPPILECGICHCEVRQDHICIDPDSGEMSQVSYESLAGENNIVQREVTLVEDEKCLCGKKNRPTCQVCHGTGIVPAGTIEMRWAQPVEFNPNSSKQVIAFMTYMKHPIPKHSKHVRDDGSAADTTEVKELQRLFVKTKHPIYPLLIEKRQLTKMKGTYYEGYKPWADGRIHTTFTIGQTATWQLSCCAAWTPVTTKRGMIPISRIKIGDYVWTHQARWRMVTAVWVHPAQPMVGVKFSNGQVLTCTTAHRVLASNHGYIKAMVDESKHSGSFEAGSRIRLPNESANRSGVPYDRPQHRMDSQESIGSGRVSSAEGSTLLAIKNGGEESVLWKTRTGNSKLDWRSGRWVRISDVLAQWKEEICASDCAGERIGVGRASEVLRRSSHRWKQKEQSIGQSSLGNSQGASGSTCNFGPGDGEIQIEEVYPMGSLPVYDITVDEDGSYESCGIFSHNSKMPNVQNSPARGKTPFQKGLVESFNKMLCASPGHMLVNFDFKSFHAQTTACEAGLKDYLRLAKIDIHSFVACHFLKLPERFDLLKWPDADLKAFLNGLKKDKQTKFHGMNFSEIRSKSKACIAEGEMVWTNHGSKPIQNVTIDDQLWDGVEWVHHEGLIYQGKREVMTYEGLTATPDHKVFTASGTTYTLREAASRMERLCNSGTKGNPLRIDRDYQFNSDSRKGIYQSQNPLPNLRAHGNGGLCLPTSRKRNGLFKLRPSQADKEPISGNLGKALRRDNQPMLQPIQSGVFRLRRQGNNLQVRQSERVRAVCGEGITTSILQGCGDRSNKQRRELRTGKFAPSDSQDANEQSKNYGLGDLEGEPNSSSRLGLSVYDRFDPKSCTSRNDRRRDYCSCSSSCSEREGEDLEETSPVARIARVYDLKNAGPRHRFTVSGVLVHNCSLGIGFAMGPRKLYQLYQEDFANLHEAEAIHDLIICQLFPGLRKWQNEVRKKASEQGYLMSRFGAIRHFYDVTRWDRNRQKMVPGEQAEQAVAFLPASNAFGMIRWVMLKLWEMGIPDRFEMINTTHDSLLFDCPNELVEQCKDEVIPIMQAPCPMMVYPGVTGTEGLSVEAECEVGLNKGELH